MICHHNERSLASRILKDALDQITELDHQCRARLIEHRLRGNLRGLKEIREAYTDLAEFCESDWANMLLEELQLPPERFWGRYRTQLSRCEKTALAGTQLCEGIERFTKLMRQHPWHPTSTE